MSKGYWVGAYRTVRDAGALTRYSALATPAILAAGGRFLSRGIADDVREQGVKDRTVVIEFESVEKAVSAYESEAYKKALAALGNAVDRDFRIVRGVD
jgi:uncharacterized protein (DUF1330 family)